MASLYTTYHTACETYIFGTCFLGKELLDQLKNRQNDLNRY